MVVLLLALLQEATEAVRDGDIAIVRYDELTASVKVVSDRGPAKELARGFGAVIVELPPGASKIGRATIGDARPGTVEGVRVEEDTLVNDTDVAVAVVVKGREAFFVGPRERRRVPAVAFRVISGRTVAAFETSAPSGWRFNTRSPEFVSVTPRVFGLVTPELDIDESIDGLDFREMDVAGIGFGARLSLGLLTVSGSLFWGGVDGTATVEGLSADRFGFGEGFSGDFEFDGSLFGWMVEVGWPAIVYENDRFEFSVGPSVSVIGFHVDVDDIDDRFSTISFGIGLPVATTYYGVQLELVPGWMFADAEGFVFHAALGYEMTF